MNTDDPGLFKNDLASQFQFHRLIRQPDQSDASTFAQALKTLFDGQHTARGVDDNVGAMVSGEGSNHVDKVILKQIQRHVGTHPIRYLVRNFSSTNPWHQGIFGETAMGVNAE